MAVHPVSLSITNGTVVDGDPLLDIRVLADVRAVIVGGEIAYMKE